MANNDTNNDTNNDQEFILKECISHLPVPIPTEI